MRRESEGEIMAGSGNIRAGAAFVEVSLKDDFSKPLKAMGQKFKRFGSEVASLGATIAAAGAGISAPFVAGVKAFADFGSAIYDAGQRSGLSAELISTLQYAAEQTGATLGDVEVAAKKLNVTLASAAKGEKAGVNALAAIGLAYEDLAGLSPDQQFRKVSSALAGVKDNAKQVAAAVDLFGKSGTNVLPLIRDFDNLEGAANRLGLVMSGKDAAAAVLGTAAAFFELGKALDSVGVSLDKLDAVKGRVAAVAEAIEGVDESSAAVAEAQLRKDAMDLKSEFSNFKGFKPGKTSYGAASPLAAQRTDSFAGIDAAEAGAQMFASQSKAKSALSGIFGQIAAPFQAVADALTAEPAKNRGSQSFTVTEQIFDFTKKAFSSEGAFAGLNIASFLGSGPDSADDTAKNTGEIVKKQEKTNTILQKIYEDGGLKFA